MTNFLTNQQIDAEIDCLNDELVDELKGKALRAIYKKLGGVKTGHRGNMREFIKANYRSFDTSKTIEGN